MTTDQPKNKDRDDQTTSKKVKSTIKRLWKKQIAKKTAPEVGTQNEMEIKLTASSSRKSDGSKSIITGNREEETAAVPVINENIHAHDDETETVDETPPSTPPRPIMSGLMDYLRRQPETDTVDVYPIPVPTVERKEMMDFFESAETHDEQKLGEEDEEEVDDEDPNEMLDNDTINDWMEGKVTIKFEPAEKAIVDGQTYQRDVRFQLEQQEEESRFDEKQHRAKSSFTWFLFCLILFLAFGYCSLESPVETFQASLPELNLPTLPKGLGGTCTLNEQCQSDNCLLMPPLQHGICSCQVCTNSGCGGCFKGEKCIMSDDKATTVCKAMNRVGDTCLSHDDCESQACGYASAASGVQKTCCASGHVSSASSYLMGYEYCTDMEQGSACWYSSDCQDGLYCHTSNSWSTGTCTGRGKLGEVCDAASHADYCPGEAGCYRTTTKRNGGDEYQCCQDQTYCSVSLHKSTNCTLGVWYCSSKDLVISA
jgi:hypothetical protein